MGPTTPSTAMRAEDCWAFTARRVAGPKEPSTAIEAPCAFSRCWRWDTAAPRAPWRSFTEVYWLLAGALGAVLGTVLGARPRTAPTLAGAGAWAVAAAPPVRAAVAETAPIMAAPPTPRPTGAASPR